MVQLIHRKEIDTERWNDVIAHSAGETLYAYAWYLDAAAENWSALIMDDYRFIMPLIWRKKFGIKYAYHPNFVQQLGVFSKEFIDPVIVKMFLRQLPSKFKYGNLRFNTSNLIGEEHHFMVADRLNFELALNRDYDSVYNDFSTNAKRNLKKALDFHPEIIDNITMDDLISLKKENDISGREDSYFDWMHKLFSAVKDHGKIHIIGAKQEGRLVAAALFAFSRKRAIYLLSVSNSEGKDTRAMFGILERFIKLYAGTDIILDFEGSNIPSIARFFNGFGAKPKVYQAVDFARFPVSMRKLKGDG